MKRWTLRIVILLLVLGAVLVLLAPTLVGTGPGRRFVAARLSTSLGRPVELAELDAGWGSGVRLRGLRIGNDAEFSKDALAEVRTLRIDDSLTGLLFGDGPTRISADGLVLRVEERAGGRTNLDDILTRLAEAPPVPPEKRRPRPPMRIELTDCTFELSRLPRRPQPRPVDPFREDPVVLPADEGRVVLSVERFSVRVASDATRTDVGFEGAVALDGKGGHVKGDVSVAGADASGSVSATGFDLAAVARFAPLRTLEGTVDLKASGSPEGFEWTARATRFRAAGAEIPPLFEEWIELAGKGRAKDDYVVIERLRLETASGEIDIDGAGTVPPQEDAGFRVAARLPTRLVFLAAGREPGEGRIALELDGTRRAAGVDLKGTLHLDDFVFADPALRAVGPTSLRAGYDLGYADGTLTVRKLEARAAEFELDLRGEATLRPRLAGDFTGRASADLERVHRFLAPFLPLEEEARIRGRAKLASFAVAADEAGNLALTAAGTLRDFAASGIVEETLRCARGEFEVDAALEEDGDALRVAKGRFNDLRASGRVAGLKARELRSAEGTVKGTVELTSLLARLADADGIETLGGRLEIDATAKTTGPDIAVRGAATVTDLLVRGAFGEVRHARVDLAANGARKDAAWSGTANLILPRAEVGATLKPWKPKDAPLSGTVTAAVKDVAELSELVPGLAMPEGLAVSGPARVQADVTREAGLWKAGGTVASGAWSARFRDAGVRSERVLVRFDARQTEDGILVAVPHGRLENHDVTVKIERVFVGDEALDGRVRVELPLRMVPSIWPDAAARDPRGDAVLEATVRRGDAWTVDARADVADFDAILKGRRVPSKRLTLRLKGTTDLETANVETLSLVVDDASVSGAGTLGRATDFTLEAKGDLGKLAPFFPDVDGAGTFGLKATLVGTVDFDGRTLGDGPIRCVTSFHAERLTVGDVEMERARGEYALEGRRTGGDYRDLAGAGFVHAASARQGSIAATGVEIDETGSGALLASGRGQGYTSRPQIRVKELRIDGAPFENAVVKVRGTLQGLGGDALEDLDLAGEFRFRRATTGLVTWTGGRADLTLKDRVAKLENLEGVVNEGRVTGWARVDLSERPVRWRSNLEAADVKISEDLGRPLSFLVPILRLSRKRARRSLDGILDARLEFSGTGTTMDLLEKSLSGNGRIDFREVAVQGSVLLPLLSLRIGEILTRRPYRFSDVNVVFRVADGVVKPEPIELSGEPFGMKIEGEARLEGRIDFVVKSPLLPIPLRVKGDIDDPKVRPAPFARLPFGK